MKNTKIYDNTSLWVSDNYVIFADFMKFPEFEEENLNSENLNLELIQSLFNIQLILFYWS